MKVGILTFHCSDNNGAMLQAYALKAAITGMGHDAHFVNYCPPYMTGRHWWIPYVPERTMKQTLRTTLWRFRLNLARAGHLRKTKQLMARFRREVLLPGAGPALWFDRQLRSDPSERLVVGSDQIWNPAITLGLRKAYFGAFSSVNRKLTKERSGVIAYAASLGSARIPQEYEQQFKELASVPDAISLREAKAIPFVQELTGKEVCVKPDPVLLLPREEWERLALTARVQHPEHYILYFATEQNAEMIAYAHRLSCEKGLRLLELSSDGQFYSMGDRIAAGPYEFLALIRDADYVVTNSFHATAFSIIFQKQFSVFPHMTRGLRLENLLALHGLENRAEGADFNMDAAIDWTQVEKRSLSVRKEALCWLEKELDND